jgi:hypothetical protein
MTTQHYRKNKTMLFNSSSSCRAFGLAIAAAVCNMHMPSASAAGLTDYEATECVAAAGILSTDTANCVDTALPDCNPPDWFPADRIPDTYDSAAGGGSRWNQTEYSPGDYTRWRHTWYSDVSIPYGPALPNIGHQWDQYAGASLVKTTTCDEYSTYSYP